MLAVSDCRSAMSNDRSSEKILLHKAVLTEKCFLRLMVVKRLTVARSTAIKRSITSGARLVRRVTGVAITNRLDSYALQSVGDCILSSLRIKTQIPNNLIAHLKRDEEHLISVFGFWHRCDPEAPLWRRIFLAARPEGLPSTEDARLL